MTEQENNSRESLKHEIFKWLTGAFVNPNTPITHIIRKQLQSVYMDGESDQIGEYYLYLNSEEYDSEPQGDLHPFESLYPELANLLKTWADPR